MPNRDTVVESLPVLRTEVTPFLSEAARYLLASAAALILDFSILWACVNWLHWPAWLAGAIGYSSGLVLIYGLSVTWVFRHRRLRDKKYEFLIFGLLGAIGLVLNSLTLTLAIALGATLALAKLLSAGVGFLANFLIRRKVLF